MKTRPMFFFPDGRRLGRSAYGFLFRQRRRQLGLTLPEVAAKARISKGLLSGIERGADFQVTTLNKICTALLLYPTLGERQAVRGWKGER